MNRVWMPLGCILIQLVSVRTGHGPHVSGVPASIVSGLAGIGSGLALLGRGRWPLAVLAATAAGYLLQVGLGSPVLPAAVVVASELVARRAVEPAPSVPRGRALLAIAGALAAVAAAVTITGTAFLAAPFGLLVLGAAYLGQFRSSRAASLAAARRELVMAERLRIARDLHDVVGHGMGAITVQAGAARLAVAAGDGVAAIHALATIEDAGRNVLREVRWLVGLLRVDDARRGAADIVELVSAARRSGLDVEFDVDGVLTATGADSGEAAYRIVQEALTNVLRHSRRAPRAGHGPRRRDDCADGPQSSRGRRRAVGLAGSGGQRFEGCAGASRRTRRHHPHGT